MTALTWPKNPIIYEINVWVWLQELSQRYQHPIKLATVPAEEWDAIAAIGLDALWLMGVWERSPAGIHIARQYEDLHGEYHRLLPNYSPDDLVGSPYSVHRYVVDDHLGWPDNASYTNLLAWCWRQGDQRRLIVVNLSNQSAQGHIRPPWGDLAGRAWRLTDVFSRDIYERTGDEMCDPGLYVALEAWGFHFLRFEKI